MSPSPSPGPGSRVPARGFPAPGRAPGRGGGGERAREAGGPCPESRRCLLTGRAGPRRLAFLGLRRRSCGPELLAGSAAEPNYPEYYMSNNFPCNVNCCFSLPLKDQNCSRNWRHI
ncbi:unnamed protein product [Rangifer tarandus platyrhynchus]|uniref:Uncharacterized protein n=1 Tax=Rangifer tarandus platyrhynchus TaxID=3082113 RepID=A0ABN8YTJ9_RANTA|nr:unnamed protein product [Rangifer tarandus platyrhynchus]